MSRQAFLERIGWKQYLRPFLYKELPPGTGWAATLGSLCALLFAVMTVTGIFLAMYYSPSPDKAYQSIDYIMKDVPMGALLRGIHHWGAGAMVFFVFLHLAANFFSGTFKAPREATWTVGVVLFLITLGLGFTGYLLPWDMKAFWATTVSANIPKDIPLIGDFIARIIRGGETVSGVTLTRFYAIHMLLLPALLLLFTAFHIYMVRIHGLASPVTRDKTTATEDEAKTAEAETEAAAPEPEKQYRFYPEHALRSALVFTVVFAAIVALAIFGTMPREEIAGTFSESYLPRPEWYFMWLFQLLTYFSGAWESVGSLAIPTVGIALLFAIPFLGKGRLTRAADRPLAVAAGASCVVAIVYLTLMGFEGARSYGEIVPVPARQLTATEQRGLYLFADRQCAYCHQISGQGGHRTGPDLANTVARHRTKEYLTRFIKNPQAVSRTSIMPKYNFSDADLQSLADFVLALDFSKYPQKILKRSEILKTSPDANAANAASAGAPRRQWQP
ncbi:MAG: cytochrome b N-terminal domain-containing protein [Candidatus Korobacteraceae bacterium]